MLAKYIGKFSELRQTIFLLKLFNFICLYDKIMAEKAISLCRSLIFDYKT